jgi:pimeloyl-ACP methyl ester carboxylesterase
VAASVQTLESRVLLSAKALSSDNDAHAAAIETGDVLTEITGSFQRGGSSFAAQIRSIGPNGIDNTRNTWILIHGWNSSPSTWADAMGASLAARLPGDTVLTFDWSAASNTSIFRPDLSEARIQPAAAWLADQLQQAGFNASQLNFIGHSHGAYVASEAAERITGLERSLFLLDPATDVSGGFNPDDPNEVNFAREAQASWAFTDGSSSNFGSSVAAATAERSLVVRGGDHSLYRMFRTMIETTTPATAWFDIQDVDKAVPWELNQFDDVGSPTGSVRRHEAVINLASDKITIQTSAYFPLGDTARLASRSPRVLSNLPSAAPVIANFGGAVTYREGSVPLQLATSVTVRDTDSTDFTNGVLTVALTANATADDRLAIRHVGNAAGQIGINGADVLFGGIIIGTFSGGIGANPLVVTFNERSTPAAAEALLRNVTFANVSTNPSLAARTVRVTLTDGQGGSSSAVTKSIAVTAVNNAPTIGDFDGTTAFVEAAGDVSLDDDASVGDPDSADFNTGKLTVRISANGHADDRLTIRNEGSAPGQVGVVGTDVRFGGISIGTLSGGVGTTALVVTFKATADVTVVQAVLRSVRFSNVSANPTTLPRTLQVTLTDGDGGTSPIASKSVTVQAVNTPPAVVFGTDINFARGGVAIPVAATATLSDPDSTNFNGGSLSLQLTTNAEVTDQLRIQNQGTGLGKIGLNGANVTYGGVLIGTFAGGDGNTPLVVSLTSNAATPIAVQALLRAITFASTLTAPSPADRTLDVILDDGNGAASAARTKAVRIIHNTVLAGWDSATAYTEDAAPVIIDSAVTLTDSDTTSFAGFTLQAAITANATPADKLGIRHQGNGLNQIGFDGVNVRFQGTIIGTATGGDGINPLVIILNAAANQAALRNLVQNLTFANVSNAPSIAPRTITLTVTDAASYQNLPVSKTVTVMAKNDAPVLGLFDGSVSYAVGTPVLIDEDATVADADLMDFAGGKLTLQLSNNVQSTDRLQIRNSGTGPGQIGVSGNVVTFGGVAIGTFTGGSGLTALAITFNANANQAAVEALLQSIEFNSLAATPSPLPRLIRATLTDGDGGTSNTVQKSILFA